VCTTGDAAHIDTIFKLLPHTRKGPNRVGFVGIFQPFRDAIKLCSREHYFPLVYNYLIYYFSIVFGLFLSLLVWVLIP
jgi:NADH:ubiquinone oxidoreductase subunit H